MTPRCSSLLITLACVAGCGGEAQIVGTPLAQPAEPSVLIQSPANGSVLGGARILVRGQVTSTWLTHVLINGVSAPAEGGIFTAWVDVDNGLNTIAVIHPDSGTSHTIEVLVDKWPPVLDLFSPDRGSFLSAAGQVTVSLSAFDESGLARVTVGDVALDLNDGPDWTLPVDVVSGVNTLRVVAEDALGNVASEHVNVLVGPFGDPKEVLHDAVIVHLGPAALRSFEDVVAAAADSLDYTKLASALNPVIASDSVTVNVLSVTIGKGTEIHLRTAVDHIELELTVRDWSVNATVAALGLSWDAVLFIPRTTVVVPISITPVDGIFDAALETPVFDFEAPELTLSDPDGAVPGTAALDGPVLESLENILTDTALAHGVGLLDLALAKLTEPFSRAIAGFELGVQLTALSADVGKHGLELRLSGVLTVEGESVVAPEDDPGPLRTPSNLVLQPRSPFATVALSDDLINAAAHGIWRVGGLVRNVDEAVQKGIGTSSLLAGFLIGLTDPDGLSLDPEAALTIDLIAPLPPIVGGVEGAEDVSVLLPDVSIGFQTEGQPPVTGFLTAGFTASALTDGDTLQLTLDTERTAFDLSIGDPDVERRVEAEFEPVVKHLLGELGPLFDELIGSIPIPQLGPFQPVNLSVGTEGTGGEYIVLRGALQTAD